MRSIAIFSLACAGACGGAPSALHPPSPAAASTGTAIVAACDQPERHQFDFFVGTWDAVVRGHATPDAREMTTARATERISKILGGCVMFEEFSADGPGTPWAGRSLTQWVPAEHQWKQTWVDDQGTYLLHYGGLEHGAMTLYSPPTTRDGVTTQKRMVFYEVHPDAIRWRWEHTTDGGAIWTPEILIDFTRRR